MSIVLRKGAFRSSHAKLTRRSSRGVDKAMPRRPSYLPDEEQELLLKAILLDGDAAIANWQAWRARVSVEHMDFASQRLLPLLLQKLETLGIDHPDLLRYRSVARHIWLDNQLRMRTAVQILSRLEEAGVPTMPLKGLALAPLYYGGFRMRAMNDFDILVRPENVGAACALLNALG